MRLKNYFNNSVLSIALVGFVVAFALIIATNLMRGSVRELVAAMASVYVAEELEISLLNHNRESLLYQISGDEAHLQQRNRALQSLLHNKAEIQNTIADAAEQKLVANVQHRLDTYLRTREELEKLKLQPLEIYADAAEPLNQAYSALDRLIDLNFGHVQKLKDETEQRNKIANLAGLGAILTLLIFGYATLFSMKRLIIRPLQRLRNSIHAYGLGDFHDRVTLTGLVELKEIADTFNAMAENLSSQRERQLQFLAAIAHDLKSPLAPIKMSFESFLEDRNMDENDRKELVTIIIRQIGRLNRMIEDLLDMSRIEAGNLELLLEKVDLRELVNESVVLNRSLSPEHTIELFLPDAPVHLKIDPLRLSQVLNNLLSNAIKYSPNGGVITVRLEPREQAVLISIQDQGMGIAPEDIPHIFEPFRRTLTTKAGIPGIGLGLSTSRHIVHSHGGQIDVESCLGKGSVFKVFLPK